MRLHSRRPLAPIGVLAVVVLLAGGWPLISSRVDGDERLAPGTLRIGTGDSTATFDVGPGWTLRRGVTTPRTDYALVHGDVRLTVRLVLLLRTEDADRLWSGLRDTVRVSDPGATLSDPLPVAAADGAPGQAGTLRRGEDTGAATVYTAPDRTYAVTVVFLGPPDAARADRAAAGAVTRSVRFGDGA